MKNGLAVEEVEAPEFTSSDRWVRRVRSVPAVLRALHHRTRHRQVSYRAHISRGTVINGPDIRIDEATYVGPMCFFEAEHGGTVHIGAGVDIGPGCVFLTTTHNPGPARRRAGSLVAEDVVIESGAWLGARVTVLPGTRVGASCIVGANSLLKGEYPPNTLIVGTPARVVRAIDETHIHRWSEKSGL